jgi:hypothetical protein
MRPNQAVQLTPLARRLTWARLSRQSAAASTRSAGRSPQLGSTSSAALDLVSQAAARTLPLPYPADAPTALDGCQRRS